MMRPRTTRRLTICMSAVLAMFPLALSAQSPSSSQTDNSDLATLKAQLAEQQKQIDSLKLALEEQKKLIGQGAKSQDSTASTDNASFALPGTKKLGDVASTTPIIPAAAPVAPIAAPIASAAAPLGNAAQPTGGPAGGANPCEQNPEGPTPAFIRLGSTCLVPIGFMDLTAVWRDKNAASSIGSNFGSVPFNNVANAKLSEFRFSPQNSRIGFRFDGDWKGTHFIGYNEFDFLGTSGSLALTVTNGAFVPRLRLFWIDARKGKVEFLAGQSWSMLTPNRRGISPLPGDLFYSQVMDVNYMAGLTWTRQPGMRILYHPTKTVTFGFSVENPDQYAGGSGGGSTITAPAAYSALVGTQLDNAPNISNSNTVLAIPTLTPDFIAKVAFDPSSRLHIDVAGVERNFKIVNPNNLFLDQTSTKSGAGVQFGINGEIFKNFRLISTNYWSDGGGRYIFGQAPDAIITAAGNLSLLHSGGTVDGFEARVKNWLLWSYYGGIYIGRDTAIDAGKTTPTIGYGFPGGSQNRAINEFTIGFTQTIWSNPRYGAITTIGQYEWLERDPWAVAVGAPKQAHDNTIYFDVRYTLPGSMPAF